MKTISAREKFLTDYEIWKIVREQQGKHANAKNSQNLATITFELEKYLDESPAAKYDDRSFVRMLELLQDYDLEKIEKLMIVNAVPRSIVELHVLIEECDARFTQERLEAILQGIGNIVPADMRMDTT